MMRSTSRTAGAMTSIAVVATLACPMVSGASAQSPLPLPPVPVPVAVPPLPPAVPQAVQQLLGLAPHTQLPAAVTAPIVALLDQAASTPGVPSQVSDTLTQLGTALSSSNPPTAAQVASDLRAIAQTPGVPSQVSSQLNSVADAFDAGTSNPPGASGSTGGNGASGGNGANGSEGAIAGFAGPNPFSARFNPNSTRASGHRDSRVVRANGVVIKSVHYSAKHHTVYVVVACQAKTTRCNTAVAVYAGRRQVAKPLAKTLAPQHKATFTMSAARRTARNLAKHGGTLRAVAVSNTPYGQAHSATSIHIKRSRH